MTTKFTDLTEIAAVDVDDADVLALSDISASASRKVTVASLRTVVATELSQVQVEDDTSTVFGSVSGQRLGQSVAANLNATGTAPLYACRAWVKFDGTGTPAITASGNVSSITDNGTGDYTINFTTALPDANYSIVGTSKKGPNSNGGLSSTVGEHDTVDPTTTALRIKVQRTDNVGAVDRPGICVAVFR